MNSTILPLFEKWADSSAHSIQALPLSGSDRQYYRIYYGISMQQSVIAVFNESVPENRAFIEFSHSFKKLGLNVPAILLVAGDEKSYLIEDLGDLTLLEFLLKERDFDTETISPKAIVFYQQALKQLAFLQVEGGKTVDYSFCFPTPVFNQQSMLWDCNQFKYSYLLSTKTAFDEFALEEDFKSLTSFLSEAEADYFMFRDFQARNIMLHNNKAYFIDYQGGRKGPLQYDVASLLFQAKATLSDEIRLSLLEYYLDELSLLLPNLDRQRFKDYYYGFVLLRCLQVLGAYGFKGYFERKEHFLSSIPFAIENINWFLNSIELPIELTHLKQVLQQIINQNKKTEKNKAETVLRQAPLKLYLRSFSYKKGALEDQTGHGIGYVFDCRLVHNPGRYEPYKKLSGLDAEVKAFLEENGDMKLFLNPIFQIAEQAVKVYWGRGFTDLSFNFGCTGGQHRSVYATEALANYIKNRFSDFDLELIVEHREKNNWPMKV